MQQLDAQQLDAQLASLLHGHRSMGQKRFVCNTMLLEYKIDQR